MTNDFILLGCGLPPYYGFYTATKYGVPFQPAGGNMHVCSVASLPSGRVVGVNPDDHQLYTKKNLNSSGKWKAVDKSATQIKSIATSPDNFSLFGVGLDNCVYKRISLDKEWEKLTPDVGGVVDVTVLSPGILLGAGEQVGFWISENDNPFVNHYRGKPIPDNGTQLRGIAVLPNGHILGIDMGYNLLQRNGIMDNWLPSPYPANVSAVHGMKLQNTEVIIAVDVESLTEENKDVAIKFLDPDGGTTHQGPADLTSLGDKGQKIVWQILNESSTKVDLSIENVFPKAGQPKILNNFNKVDDNKWEADISNDYPSGKSEEYQVTIRVTPSQHNNPQGYDEYTIDPKMRIH